MNKIWKIGVVKDTSKPMLGLHALHTAFRGLPNVEVVGHVDSNTEDIEQKMGFTQAKRHYATLRDMLDKESLDIVVLCSRHPYDHLEQIRAAAEKGCHIYCEKPISALLQEADEIVEIAEKNCIKICMAHPSRYDLGFLTMKKMVEAGEIGDPVTAYGRGKNDHRGGGEDLIVLGTHILDIQTFFFGTPEYVFADVTANGRPITKDDVNAETVEPIGPAAGDEVFAYFRFPGSVRGIFESKRGLRDKTSPAAHMGITVIGTNGALSIRFEDASDRPLRPLRISRTPGPPEDESHFEIAPLTEYRTIPDAEPLNYSLCGQRDIPRAPFFLESNRFAVWDLMRAIAENRQPVSNIYNARLALEMIHGIYASHLARSIVNFPLIDRTHPLDG
ncbi:MAG: Gfo/Idh/MocA family oxidoreductase [Planctomycetota bacterium]